MKKMNIGDKFGLLTITNDIPIKKNNRLYYECECECGTKRTVAGIDLRSGHTKSCGCTRGKKLIKDMKNKRFGKLLVLEQAGSNERGLALWKCKCDCGNETIVIGASLRNNLVKSCGCLKKEFNKDQRIDLTNQHFGKLTALEPIYLQSTGVAGWKCECECGNIIEVPTHLLISNQQKSCGCIKSKGEFQIIQLLKQNNINFTTQYRVKIEESYKFFDFAILDNQNKIKYLIEYDGSQHFNKKNNWEPLETIQKRDKLKNQWCKKNNIPLIRIPYWHYDFLTIKDLILEESEYKI